MNTRQGWKSYENNNYMKKYLQIYGMAAFFQNSKKLGIVCSLNVVPGHVIGDTSYLYISIIVKAKVGLF